jgi:hypothetical protein
MTKNSSHVQKKQVVESTSKLRMFKILKGNRPPNPQHIKRLCDSIKKYGMLVNPILVNELNEVIDGQHRLLAAIEANSPIYYIVVEGYSLTEVHALNLNQKNWTSADFLEGYANLGVQDYILLKEFCNRHPYFNITDCIAMCSNITSGGNFSAHQKHRGDKTFNIKEIFNEGTWKVRDMKKAETDAQNIKLIEPYFSGYNNSSFIGSMLLMFNNPKFDFNEFMQKVRLQPTALVICANRDQYKALIEDIYNFRRREKINLRY